MNGNESVNKDSVVKDILCLKREKFRLEIRRK